VSLHTKHESELAILKNYQTWSSTTPYKKYEKKLAMLKNYQTWSSNPSYKT
jgi:hypothetical protein